MINLNKKLFKWGPIPGRLISVSHWVSIYCGYPGRSHNYYWSESYLFFHRGRIFFVSDLKKLQKTGGRVFKELILTDKLTKYWQLWRNRVRQLKEFYKKIDKDYLAGLSQKGLEIQWKKLNKLLYLFWGAAVIPELGAYGGEPMLIQAISENIKDERMRTRAFSVLSAPDRLSFYQVEERDLLKVMKYYGRSDFTDQLAKHQKKYFWLGNSYHATKVLDQKYFLSRVKEFKKKKIKPYIIIKQITNHLKAAKANRVKMLRYFRNKKKIAKLAKGLSFCVWWQDLRKSYIFEYQHYLILFLSEFARRSRISPKVFDMAMVDEVCLNPHPQLIMELKKRKKGYFLVHFFRNRQKFSQGFKVKQLLDKIQSGRVKSQEIKGLVIYSTDQPVYGQVYLIKTVKDIKKFPSGKILVTTMTAPEYITAIRKAKAIITDHGGLTCHAAIVARELKVPCVVGTEFATKVLKNGDKVEVDTYYGKIRKF